MFVRLCFLFSIMVLVSCSHQSKKLEVNTFKEAFIQNHITQCIDAVSSNATKDTCKCQAEEILGMLSINVTDILQYTYEVRNGNENQKPSDTEIKKISERFGLEFSELSLQVSKELNTAFIQSKKLCNL